MSDEDFPLPTNIGDVYLLKGYLCRERSILAFATQITDPEREGRWIWALAADDGDIYPCRSAADFHDECFCDEVILIRRAREGLRAYLDERAPGVWVAEYGETLT